MEYKPPKRSRFTKKKKALNYQEGGKHYTGLAIQPVVYCYKNKLNNIDSNIVKYATRTKPGETTKQRYKKVIHYAKIGIELDDQSD